MPTHPSGRQYRSFVALLRAEERSLRLRLSAPTLSFLQREIARLHDAGYNPKEIATLIGITRSTVYYHLDVIKRHV